MDKYKDNKIIIIQRISMKNQIKLKLNDFPFHHKLKTRWRDLDAFNHVNNAIFLSYIEDLSLFFQL